MRLAVQMVLWLYSWLYSYHWGCTVGCGVAMWLVKEAYIGCTLVIRNLVLVVYWSCALVVCWLGLYWS